jgi:hypothetical protein
MGDALGTVGQAGMNTLTGLHDTGAGIRDFLAGPGSAQQPIVQQVLGSVLGAMLFDQAPGLLGKLNADKQNRIDVEQGRLNQYLDLPQGREALGTGALDSLQALFPHATLPHSIPLEAGPVPAGMNAVATGPSGGPTTGAFVLPMSPEQRGVARSKALIDEATKTFPIGQYDAPGASLSISDQGDVQVGTTIKPRPDTEMLVAEDEIDPAQMQAQGISALPTRFADKHGVPLVLLQQDKAAEAARIQAAKTAVVEASQLRRIGATGAQSRQNIQMREDLLRDRPEKPAKVPVPKAGDFKRRVIDRLIKMKLAGATFNTQQQELYDRLVARPSQLESLLGGAGAAPTGGTTSSGNSFTPAGP